MNKTTSREQFIPETRVVFSNDSGCYLKKIPCVLLSLIFIGSLAGVIALAVLFSQKGHCSLGESTLSTILITTTKTIVTTTSRPITNEDYRLNKDVIPLKYDLKIQPFLDGKFSYFNGSIKITILCKTATSRIELHSRYLNTSDIKVSKESVDDCLSDVMVVNSFKTELTDKLTLQLDGNLTINNTYKICISFNGSMVDSSYKGFYVSEYKDKDDITHYLGATQFQTTSARQAFPCFDEPGFRSKFKIQIIREAKYHSLSNMELENTTKLENGWYLDIFKESVEMSTYLVAFLVSDFMTIENIILDPVGVFQTNTLMNLSGSGKNLLRQNNQIKINVWTNPTVIDQADWSFSIGENIIEHLGVLLDSPYPLNKLDMVALSDFAAGAMENWGLIKYREIAFLYDSKSSIISSKEYVAGVVAHEINHMWFGNLVGPEWWSESWLNEGFASYFVYQVIAAVHPIWNSYRKFVTIDDCDIAFRADARNTSKALKYDVYSPSEVSSMFGSIIYSKGACFLHMLSEIFGEQTFLNAIKEYIKENANSAVNQDKLFSYFKKHFLTNEIDVLEFLNTWSLKAGYPVVKIFNVISINDTHSKFQVSQKRFLINPSQTSEETIWNIPLKFYSINDLYLENLYWLKEKETEFVISFHDDWIIGNVDQVGFYRVNYDDMGWNSIIMNYEQLPELTRTQVISDSFNLARASQLEYKYPLKLLRLLGNESTYAPWKIAAIEIDKLLISLQGNFEFTKFIKNIAIAAYDPNYWKKWDSDEELEKQLLANIIVDLACTVEHEECINKAREVFDIWTKENRTDVASILLPTAVCTSLKYGTIKDFELALDKFIHSNVIAEKLGLLAALTCTRDPWVLKDLMLRTMKSDFVRPINAYLVFRNIAFNKDASQLFLDFMQEHWVAFESGFSSMFSSTVVNSISGLASGLSTNYDKEKMETLKTMVNPKYHPFFNYAIEIIDENIQWLERHEKEIQIFLS